MKSLRALLVLLVVTASLSQLTETLGATGCGDLTTSLCGVTSQPAKGDFRGLIMVRDQPDVLDRAASAGTSPGCGDCVWEAILSCPTNLPGAPADPTACGAASNAPRCRPGQQ